MNAVRTLAATLAVLLLANSDPLSADAPSLITAAGLLVIQQAVAAASRPGQARPLAVLATLPPLPAWPEAPTWWPAQGGNLGDFISALEQIVEQMLRWAQQFRASADDILTRLVRETPGQLPDASDLPDMLAHITVLPYSLQAILEAVRAKLLAPIAPGSLEERHHAYTESSPALAHEAVDIAATDEVIAGGTVQQAVASQAAAAAAAAVSRDRRPQAVPIEAQQAGDALVSATGNLPSTRAGMELLIAGFGAGLHQQADLQAATADRLTVLVQQTAQVSQQLSALAATSAAMTLRLTEQDRSTLDSRLGFADAVNTAANVLQDALGGMGDSAAAEPILSPLY
jgi:hypothetical protein